MKQETYDKVRKSLDIIYGEDEEYYNMEDSEDRASVYASAVETVDALLEEHKPLTFEEVCGKWYSTTGLQVRECQEFLEVYSEKTKTSYYRVYHDRSGHRVWINPNLNNVSYQNIKLLDLTVNYVEAQIILGRYEQNK